MSLAHDLAGSLAVNAYQRAERPTELEAARKIVALVRRWTRDHPSPCWCLLCNGLRRFDEETQ